MKNTFRFEIRERVEERTVHAVVREDNNSSLDMVCVELIGLDDTRAIFKIRRAANLSDEGTALLKQKLKQYFPAKEISVIHFGINTEILF